MSCICISSAEVTTINRHGFWIQCGEEELYVPFVEFPCFEHATVPQICQVRHVSFTRLYWPELDLDFTLESLRNPLAFPHDGLSYDC
jgi:hypothetical protein